MAIDFTKTRQIVLFEIDRKDPHDLARFHRNISQAMAEGTISDDDFEEVIGMYEGVMNVAYCMSARAYNRIFDRLEWYMRHQTEVYEFDMDTVTLFSKSFYGMDWRSHMVDWVEGFAFGGLPHDAKGWTYFPSSKTYFTIVAAEQN